ncbi:MAG: hypothetical protein LW850_34655 [Planctomycetaceae bacterium]|nr:hypothetical protein [Planctomycetaceae bacterium]
MIDFTKITKTLVGLDCYYLGQRISGDQVLHRFAVVNPAGEKFVYYNDQGQRIDYASGIGKWVVRNDGHQIIAPPKIVEVTRWVALQGSTFDGDGYHVACYGLARIDF